MGGTVRIQGADATTNSTALAATLVASTVACRLYSITVYNTDVADRYIQVFDAVAVPTAGAWDTTIRLQLKVPTDYHGSFDFGDGRLFSTGCSIAVSTTNTLYTAAGDVCLIDATLRKKA